MLFQTSSCKGVYFLANLQAEACNITKNYLFTGNFKEFCEIVSKSTYTVILNMTSEWHFKTQDFA